MVVLKNVQSYEILSEILTQLRQPLSPNEFPNNYNYDNNRVRFEFKSSDAAQKAFEFFNNRKFDDAVIEATYELQENAKVEQTPTPNFAGRESNEKQSCSPGQVQMQTPQSSRHHSVNP